MPCYQRSGLAHDFIELDLDFLSMKSDREAVHSAAEMSRYATNRRPGGYQERVHATLHTQAVSEDNEVSCNGEDGCALIRSVGHWMGHHVGEGRLVPTPPVMICASIAGCQVVQMWRCESQSSIRVRGRLVWRQTSQDDHEAIAGPQ
ncbi:hypothetical protein COCC4DRAFT_19941 [Bipolaris maydis ATCC 48331]|uniref:Uncharacterized protein n=2 Tax=Cochliobolus heterostrophus TaxID=5016 RepID=M2URN9_COCH5|nr:uncharacterized protein COCC4DRAFT_19941 [Bipolaris maydis ATCC 48331]EMD90562.1 hypothetical protein COCHEDRAFT_1031857 [Bipolaris maydis C5]ENI09226.1 hypothetical protein COCC4DRAFT_19941 [Bipolaris maydis ATCC 48331]